MSEAGTLSKTYPDMSISVQEKMDMLNETWVTANKKIDNRKADLEDSMQYHQFVSNCNEFQAWLLDLDKKIKSVVAPNSVTGDICDVKATKTVEVWETVADQAAEDHLRTGYKVLCVSALHPKASDDVVRDTLYREFKKYGDISVRVMHEPDERVAYVYFRSFEDARDAKHSKSRIILF